MNGHDIWNSVTDYLNYLSAHLVDKVLTLGDSANYRIDCHHQTFKNKDITLKPNWAVFVIMMRPVNRYYTNIDCHACIKWDTLTSPRERE